MDRRGLLPLLLVGMLACALLMGGVGWVLGRAGRVSIGDPGATNREELVVTGTAISTIEPSPAPAAPVSPASLDARALLRAESDWLRQLYGSASGSVVNITSRSYSYDFFFNVVPQEGAGSGFVWDDQGHIVTNYHVVQGAQELEVRFADGTQLPASLIGADSANDLAVIRLEAAAEGGTGIETAQPLELGDSSALFVGERVLAIGNPFGFEHTLTTGVISALGRVIQSESGEFIGEVVQHDAAINPGNSGGPLLDMDGRVIGVNTQIVSPSGASAGIGFAIPASTVQRVVPELIARGRYPHPWMGFESVDVTRGLAERLRRGNLPLDADEGMLIVGVYRDGPADGVLRGGTQRVQVGNFVLPLGGDLLVALDGQPILNQREMMLYLESQKRVSDKVVATVWREGQLVELEIVLAERPQR